MIDQTLFDTLADRLVEAGEPVSYEMIQAALMAHRGSGTSDRDLQGPYADWRRRRRYKPNIAALDPPPAMEKAIATFFRVATAQADAQAAARHVPIEAELRGRIAELELRVEELDRRNRQLEAQVHRPDPRPSPGGAVPGRPPGRKRGADAATSRFFWDRVVRELATLIRLEGPRDLGQLLEAIAPGDAALAATAFRPITRATLEKALAERTKRKRHRLLQLDDGRYDVERGPREAHG